ncbi:MAG TPA: TetR/AcrR family transcriptional regulator [Burkholderiales bacterium]|nr:TetR/AcrR family transcriptional regulator [Burkholderiales bacterium]
MNDRLANRTERRWTRRKEARPEEITAAALELFVEHGFANTRLEDVAARAGVSKGTLYLYFENKEELFKAVVREGLVSPLAAMKSVLEQFEGSSFELLRILLCGWWERVGSTRVSGIPKLIFSEAGNFPELARFYVAEVVEPGHAVIAAIVKRGIARGEFRAVDPDDAAQLIAAPLIVIMMWRNSLAQHATHTTDPQRYIDTHLDMLRHCLARD